VGVERRWIYAFVFGLIHIAFNVARLPELLGKAQPD
jgi:hypothetical protein